jgi:hypothetical protein
VARRCSTRPTVARPAERSEGELQHAGRWLAVLGVNAVPLAGVFWAGWDGATALSVYWWENLVGSLLVLARLVLHRRLTRKRGYRRLHLTLAAHDGKGMSERRWRKGKPPRTARPGNFVREFAVSTCAATAVHGLLLWVVVAKVLEESPDGELVRQGVLSVGTIQVLFFLFELRRLRQRPFAWVREHAETALNRVNLIHFTLLAGVWAGLRGGMSSFFGPFAVLKALADVGNVLARAGMRLKGDKTPAWVERVTSKIRNEGGTFAEYWRDLKAEEKRLALQDEEEQSPEDRRPRRRRRR